MKDSLSSKIIVGIVTLITGTLLGLWGKSCQDDKINRMRYLDYTIYVKNDILGNLSGIDSKIQVMREGQEINNLSQIDIKLFNTTDKDYSDIPVYIELLPETKDSLKFVNSSASGIENTQEFLDTVLNLSPITTKGALKFGYKIKTLNRNLEKPIFTATYLVIGTVSEEKCRVKIQKEGLELKEYNYSHSKTFPWWEDWSNWIAIPFFFIGFYSVIIYIVEWFMERIFRKRKAPPYNN